MSLTVLNVAYPFAPIGPDAVGGAEQVLSCIDQALVRAGHRSIVVASAGSRAAGTLIAVPAETGTIDEDVRQRAWARQRAAIARALQHWPIDLVHFHGVDFHEYLPRTKHPVLVTLHLPPEWYPAAARRPDRPRTWFNCVSATQHRACPPGFRLIPPVPNGVEIDPPRRTRKGSYAAMLCRICPEKGCDIALQAARRADVPLVIAGELYRYPDHERYFEEQIAPQLDRRRHFVGPLGYDRKRHFLAAARCLLIPSRVPETSSLVAMEALACGTPVIAFRAGALSEIVEHGRTGILVDDMDGLVEALEAIESVDPETCRASARARFSARRMTETYFALYRQLITCEPADRADRIPS